MSLYRSIANWHSAEALGFVSQKDSFGMLPSTILPIARGGSITGNAVAMLSDFDPLGFLAGDIPNTSATTLVIEPSIMGVPAYDKHQCALVNNGNGNVSSLTTENGLDIARLYTNHRQRCHWRRMKLPL